MKLKQYGPSADIRQNVPNIDQVSVDAKIADETNGNARLHL